MTTSEMDIENIEFTPFFPLSHRVPSSSPSL
jgi:hypothetical protein